MINGYSNIGEADAVQYLDQPPVWGFWERVAACNRSASGRAGTFGGDQAAPMSRRIVAHGTGKQSQPMPHSRVSTAGLPQGC